MWVTILIQQGFLALIQCEVTFYSLRGSYFLSRELLFIRVGIIYSRTESDLFTAELSPRFLLRDCHWGFYCGIVTEAFTAGLSPRFLLRDCHRGFYCGTVTEFFYCGTVTEFFTAGLSLSFLLRDCHWVFYCVTVTEFLLRESIRDCDIHSIDASYIQLAPMARNLKPQYSIKRSMRLIAPILVQIASS